MLLHHIIPTKHNQHSLKSNSSIRVMSDQHGGHNTNHLITPPSFVLIHHSYNSLFAIIVPISSFPQLSVWMETIGQDTKHAFWEGIHTVMCSSFHRTINVWMIFQSVCFHINIHTSHVWSKYQHSNASYKHSKLPWMFCLSIHHLYHSISLSSLLVASHSLVSISHSFNSAILIHMCLHSSHSTTHDHFHVLLSIFINHKVCA